MREGCKNGEKRGQQVDWGRSYPSTAARLEAFQDSVRQMSKPLHTPELWQLEMCLDIVKCNLGQNCPCMRTTGTKEEGFDIACIVIQMVVWTVLLCTPINPTRIRGATCAWICDQDEFHRTYQNWYWYWQTSWLQLDEGEGYQNCIQR